MQMLELAPSLVVNVLDTKKLLVVVFDFIEACIGCILYREQQ